MSNRCRKCPSNSNTPGGGTLEDVTQADVVEVQSNTHDTPCKELQPVGVVSIHRCNKHCDASVAASHQGKMLYLRFHAKLRYTAMNVRCFFCADGSPRPTNHSRQLQHSLGQNRLVSQQIFVDGDGRDDTVRG